MKKVLALALALVMALSMSAMAFAADAVNECGVCGSKFADNAAFAEHVKECKAPEAADPIVNSCPKCGRQFADEAIYNEHVNSCKINDQGGKVDLTIQELLGMLVDLVKSSMTQWDAIESVIVRLVDFLENIGTAAVGEADVKGAVADLEAALADANIPGVSDILNAIKQKIKDLYAGEVATTVVEETTEVVPPAVTGSSSIGIALFAAVSVAAAAAYVCTKKSK